MRSSIENSVFSVSALQGAGVVAVAFVFGYAYSIDFTQEFWVGLGWYSAAVSLAIATASVSENPAISKWAGLISSALIYSTFWSDIARNPFVALWANVGLIILAFLWIDLPDISEKFRTVHTNPITRHQLRARSALAAVIVLGLVGLVTSYVQLFLWGAGSAMSLYAIWLWRAQRWRLLIFSVWVFLLGATFWYIWLSVYWSSVFFTMTAIVAYGTTSARNPDVYTATHLWNLLLDHPARITVASFLILCGVGTFLLALPNASSSEQISLIDAAFTAISAVCVTGLIVLDTPVDFSGLGQFWILVLIQLGGLGTMTVTTVAIHALGRRLSLRQERIVTSMAQSSDTSLQDSLMFVIRWTFIVEIVGMILLTFLFFEAGDSWSTALWRGMFTAVSAFCNAGFALQSDSLVSYQGNPYILHTVAGLIVCGGLAPSTSILVPAWIRRRPVPLAARFALSTSAFLLSVGTFAFLFFEYNGVLAQFSFTDKLHNAWFQSVTLRTAGFNSIDFSLASMPMYLTALVMMFVGGSPGGTAGGIKTTAFALIVLTFWANVTGKNDIVIRHRKIHSHSIYRAVTVVFSGLLMGFWILFMLLTTQQIPARSLMFEAVSALGTVGLSLGATSHLDEIGKIIIMIAMFAGRVGPVTLFMVLSHGKGNSTGRYPEEEITIV